MHPDTIKKQFLQFFVTKSHLMKILMPESDENHNLLAHNGILVISELCQHDQDWVRDAAGDVWLGFNESLLDHWAGEAGLSKGPSSYTALRNGFRIQVHSYINRAHD